MDHRIGPLLGPSLAAQRGPLFSYARVTVVVIILALPNEGETLTRERREEKNKTPDTTSDPFRPSRSRDSTRISCGATAFPQLAGLHCQCCAGSRRSVCTPAQCPRCQCWLAP